MYVKGEWTWAESSEIQSASKENSWQLQKIKVVKS